MIYLLVNNDYHFFDARSHAKYLKAHGLPSILVEVPHALSETDRASGFSGQISLPSPLRGRSWLSAWPRYFIAAHEVARSIEPHADDVLFMYTEFELLNQMIALRFKRAGARVYLIEDGGVGTYIPLSLLGGETLSIKEWVVALMSRCLPGLTRTRFQKLNGVVFPWLPDSELDGVCLYRPLKIVRQIPVHVLHRTRAAEVTRKNGRVVFLNECMYDNYQSEAQYLAGLLQLLSLLIQGFDEVLFKFHPRETLAWRKRIRNLVGERMPMVTFIDNDRAMESLVEEFRPEVIASYFSTVLLNLEGSSIEPMFLYHLLPELSSQKVFSQLTSLLTQWQYRFVGPDVPARSGYRSGLYQKRPFSSTTLADVVFDGKVSSCPVQHR